jgi:hypothetical protein
MAVGADRGVDIVEVERDLPVEVGDASCWLRWQVFQ